MEALVNQCVRSRSLGLVAQPPYPFVLQPNMLQMFPNDSQNEDNCPSARLLPRNESDPLDSQSSYPETMQHLICSRKMKQSRVPAKKPTPVTFRIPVWPTTPLCLQVLLTAGAPCSSELGMFDNYRKNEEAEEATSIRNQPCESNATLTEMKCTNDATNEEATTATTRRNENDDERSILIPTCDTKMFTRQLNPTDDLTLQPEESMPDHMQRPTCSRKMKQSRVPAKKPTPVTFRIPVWPTTPLCLQVLLTAGAPCSSELGMFDNYRKNEEAEEATSIRNQPCESNATLTEMKCTNDATNEEATTATTRRSETERSELKPPTIAS